MTQDCQTTPLGRSTWRSDIEIMNLLVSLGADVNYAGPTGITPLMWAARRGHLKALHFLLEKLPDVS